MIEDYRRRWRWAYHSGPVLPGGLLLTASYGCDLVGTRTANIDLTAAATECDVEPGWSTTFDPSRSLRLIIANAVHADHIASVHGTSGFATPVPR